MAGEANVAAAAAAVVTVTADHSSPSGIPGHLPKAGGSGKRRAFPSRHLVMEVRRKRQQLEKRRQNSGEGGERKEEEAGDDSGRCE